MPSSASDPCLKNHLSPENLNIAFFEFQSQKLTKLDHVEDREKDFLIKRMLQLFTLVKHELKRVSFPCSDFLLVRSEFNRRRRLLSMQLRTVTHFGVSDSVPTYLPMHLLYPSYAWPLLIRPILPAYPRRYIISIASFLISLSFKYSGMYVSLSISPKHTLGMYISFTLCSIYEICTSLSLSSIHQVCTYLSQVYIRYVHLSLKHTLGMYVSLTATFTCFHTMRFRLSLTLSKPKISARGFLFRQPYLPTYFST